MVFYIFAILNIFFGKCTAGNQSIFFPENFSFGASTSSYQIEGAFDEDGKGENVYDHLFHTHPETTVDRRNGDIACDSYHKYKEDVKSLKEVGFNHYRFSISWSRILPNGNDKYVNKKGLQYYHNLIDALLENGIEPFVTMYHWDLPQFLYKLGGWTNPITAQSFERFARILFEEFGHKVKWWTTFNELLFPTFPCVYGDFAQPGDTTSLEKFLAIHTLLITHANVYRMYQEHFASTQKGKIGITLNGVWFEPKTTSPADIEAAERAMQLSVGRRSS